MHVILFQDTPEAADKALFLIETKYFGTVSIVKNALDAIKALEDPKVTPDLLVIDCTTISLLGEVKFWEVSAKYRTLLAEQSAPPEFLKKKDDKLQIVKRVGLIDSLTKALEALSKATPADAKTGPAYCRIKTDLLLSVAPLKGDIFIRLGENKFVKVFNEGDVFNAEDLNKYTVKKGIEYLFILREQAGEFSKKYIEELSKILSNSPSGAQISVRAMEQGNEVVRQLYKSLGWTHEVQEIAKSQALLTVKVIGKNPELGAVIEKIRALKGSYLSNHSTYTPFIACAIAQLLDWGSETTSFKICLASILHDLTLESDDLAVINTLAELEANKAKFKDEEIQAYKDHPEFISELIKNMAGAPPDVDMIILQHHELPDGTGFPKKINQKLIVALASLFIMSHEMTQAILKQGAAFSLKKHVGSVNEKYAVGNFRKIMIALLKLDIAKK
jgi:HD-GYP domain-containing protein (c-di-GMP phosphodiesterase class II)